MARTKGAKNKPKEAPAETPKKEEIPQPLQRQRNRNRNRNIQLATTLKIDTNIFDQMETSIQTIRKELKNLADLSAKVSFTPQPQRRGRPTTQRNQRSKNRPKQTIQREQQRKEFEQQLRNSLQIGIRGRIPTEKQQMYSSQMSKWDQQHQA